MKANPTVKEIVKVWLVDNGYTGLCGDECGCEIDDLAPCYEGVLDKCQAGYKVTCSGKCEHDDCDTSKWHIQLRKPKRKSK